jgi:hypothetical protein
VTAADAPLGNRESVTWAEVAQIPILAHLTAGGAGLDPIALKAVTALREAAAPR